MPRYIDADKLIEAWDRECENATDLFDAFDYAVEDTPTADVAEVKHGEWKGKPIAGYSNIRCSVCNAVFLSQTGKWHYCPNCGAKMDGKGDSESEEIVLKQENFAELPVDKFTPELTPEEKALIKLWKGQGGRDELESVLRMFGAKMDGGQTE